VNFYHASPIKRKRATNDEMEERARFLIDYADQHGPVAVRGLYYQAEVAVLPGIEKTEAGYAKVQAQVLKLRRDGRMPYSVISDSTRWMRRPRTFDGIQDALESTARLYRKSLWAESEVEVEIWIEKNSLAGVIYPVTAEYDVPLMPTGGYSSETFAFEAVNDLRGTGKTLVIYSLYDFDRSGRDADRSLKEKVNRFGREYGVPVEFTSLGLNLEQVHAMRLPTRPAKRQTVADQRWPHDFAAELDAIPPDTLRDMVREAIEQHLPAEQLAYLKQVEQLERESFRRFTQHAAEYEP
jgi:hypothetical protein